MKVLIDQSPDYEEVEITIKCAMIDEGLSKLIDSIRLYSFAITAQKEGRIYKIRLEDILYFESVDRKTFLYTQNDVYECEMRLYELEQQLKPTNFLRISKSSILNILKLESVRALLGGRMEAQLENGEKIVINRHYVEELKRKLGLLGEDQNE